MKRAARILVFACVALLTASAFADVYKCPDEDGQVTYSSKRESERCEFVASESISPKQISAAPAFRAKLKIGDMTTMGLVVEVKRPIAKIQTDRGERWYRIDALFPAGL